MLPYPADAQCKASNARVHCELIGNWIHREISDNRAHRHIVSWQDEACIASKGEIVAAVSHWNHAVKDHQKICEAWNTPSSETDCCLMASCFVHFYLCRYHGTLERIFGPAGTSNKRTKGSRTKRLPCQRTLSVRLVHVVAAA